MLVNLRKVAGTWVMAIFSFLIIVSFGIWGIGDIFRGRTSNAVITVGEVEISDLELSREFRREMNRLRALFGGDLDSDQARSLGLLDRAVDALVARALYDLESGELGLAVGDEQVRREIVDTRSFQNAAGAFDPGLFASTLAAIGLSEDQYVALLRNDIRREQLLGSVATPAPAPDVLVRALYRFREQRRAVEFFVISKESVDDVGEPDDAALATFHQENARRFTAPEYRKLTFIHITAEELADEVAVAEEEIQAEYDDRRGSLVQPEKRTVDQILLADEETAKAARDRAIAGDDFFAVAKDLAGMSVEEVALGEVTRDDLVEEVADAVFDLGEGYVSAPVQSPFGWHLFRVTAVSPEHVPALAEMRDEIERDIAMRNAVDVLYQLTNTLDDTLAAGATLEEAAAELKLNLGRVEAVDANGRTPAGEFVDNLPKVVEFLTTAFDTPEGQSSLLVESARGSYFIVRVDGVTPPALRPLDTVRDEAAAAWRDAEVDKAVAARAAKAVERIEAGEDFADAAASLGGTPATSAPLRRDGDGGERVFAPNLVAELFSRGVGKPATAPAADGSGYVVARATEIVEADPASDEAAVDALREEFGGSIAADLMSQYRLVLEARFPVSVDQRAIDALF
ncbi:MAG: peptidyl-prolyl cis-trans isomerase [Alphaproteobacteria bacterium]